MGLNVHRGWHVFVDRAAPLSGRFKANRHGVGMCAGSPAALIRMIDRRVYEEQGSQAHPRGGHSWQRLNGSQRSSRRRSTS
jgi:hypothetical protein